MATMQRKEVLGSEIQVGDLIYIMDRVRRVVDTPSLHNPEAAGFPATTRYVVCDDGAEMTIHPDAPYEIAEPQYRDPTYGWHTDDRA